MSFNQISNINVFSDNPKRLIDFYRDILEVNPQDNQNENSSWFGFRTESIEFAIEPSSNREKVAQELDIERKDRVLIQFKANSMDELIKMSNKLESQGIELLCKAKKRSYGYCSNFLDPDGNFLEIFLSFEQ